MRWWSWWTCAILLLGAIVCCIYACLITLEDRFLLHPLLCSEYVAFSTATTQTIHLPRGGLVLRCAAAAAGSFTARPILLLHGNAGNLNGMADVSRKLVNDGYDVYLLEYRGFGTLGKKGWQPSPTTLIEDLEDAWRVIPSQLRSSAILMGFSIGGGVVTQYLKRTRLAPRDLPAQVVLANTFYDLPMLVRDVFPVPFVASLMRTKWNATDGLVKYCTNQGDGGNVLLLATVDDELIPLKHSNQMLETLPAVCYKRKLLLMPSGGHTMGIDANTDLWIPELLDPRLPTHKA
jgi:dienelactone hydrolase